MLDPQDSEPKHDGAGDVSRAGPTGLLTLLFTDLIGSTQLKQDLGDREAVRLIQEHHALVRSLLGQFPDAAEVNTAGDSFLLAFQRPSDAVRFALRLQHHLRAAKEAGTSSVEDRVGIHVGEVVIEQTGENAPNYFGIQVDAAARVMGLAAGGRILLTRAAFDNARQMLRGEDLAGLGVLAWSNHGLYILKGLADPLEICEVGEEGTLAHVAPEDGEKAYRHAPESNETVPGWRPGVGLRVPDTRWTLEEKLGEGGFGEVWVGRHDQLKERRIFKFCFQADRVRSLKREVTLFRLLKERVGLHPHIVAIQEVNFDRQPWYLVMDYALGNDLEAWFARSGDDAGVKMEDRLEVVAQVADALQAAHDAGVIHRDVKPSNIIVAPATSETGKVHARLTDFGIGQVTSEEALAGITAIGFTMTMRGSESSLTGTRLYMAPEVLAGRTVTTRADIYSLGIVLYQLIVGDLSQPLTTDWESVVTDPLLREDLRRCFAGNPEMRFTGAAQLASQLRAIETRREARAREAALVADRERAAYRRGLWRAAAIGTAVLAVISALAFLSLGQARRADREAASARKSAAEETRQRHNAEASRAEASRSLSASVTVEAERLLRDDEAGKALAYLAHALRVDPQNVVAANRIISILTEKSFALPLLKIPANAAPLPHSPIVRAASNKEDHTLEFHVWPGYREFGKAVQDEGTTLSTRFVLPDGVEPKVGAIRADRDVAAVVGNDSVARLLNPKTGQSKGESFEVKSPGIGQELLFSPDGSRLWLYSLSASRTMIRNLTTDREEPTFIKHRATVESLTFRADGLVLLSGSRDGSSRLWNALTGGPVTEPIQSAYWNSDHRFSDDGSYFFEGDAQSVACWTARPGAATPRVLKCGAVVSCVAFSPDSRFLATAAESSARVWNVQTGLPVTEVMGHGSKINCVTFNPAGHRLVTASDDQTARIWDGETGKPVGAVLKHDAAVKCAVFSPDGAVVATGDESGCLKLWNATNGTLIASLGKTGAAVSCIRFNHDGSQVVISGLGSGAQVWDVKTSQTVADFSGWTWQARFSRDGQRLLVGVSGSDHAAVYPLRAETRPDGRVNALATFPHLSGVLWAEFSPDEHRVATASLDGTACVWDAATGRRITEPIRHEKRVDRAVFSPDGTQVLTASRDGTARVWDANSGRPVTEPILHAGGVLDAAFSADGRFIVTAGFDGNAIINDRVCISGNPPSWLAPLAEAVGGFTVNDQGITDDVTGANEVLDQARKAAETDPSDSSLAIWSRWFFAPRSERCLSPFSTVTPQDRLATLLSGGALRPLEEVAAAADQPAFLAALGNKLRPSDPERAEFLLARAHQSGGEDISSPRTPAKEAPAVAPGDLTTLRTLVGREVIVEGKVIGQGSSRQGNIRFLNFIEPYKSGISLVFFVTDAPDDFVENKLASYLGKTLRVRGTVTLHGDALQCRITSLEQLEVLSTPTVTDKH